VATRQSAPNDPVARIERLLGDPWKEKLASATWRSIEAAFHELRDTRSEAAIAPLARWLDHPVADVSGTAADVLLAYDARAALEVLVARVGTPMRLRPQVSHGPRGFQTDCVLACIKLDQGAYERLSPLCDVVRRDPASDDPWVHAIFLALSLSVAPDSWVRRAGLGDLPQREPRWLDLAFELAALTGKHLAIAGPALLLDTGDPRALRAYARAVRSLGAAQVASYTSYRGIRGAPFLALADDAEFADIAPALRALAAKLG
jgi:hypothetical protein